MAQDVFSYAGATQESNVHWDVKDMMLSEIWCLASINGRVNNFVWRNLDKRTKTG